MKTDLLSLDKFHATRKSMTIAQAAEHLGVEPDFFDPEETTSILVYVDSLYIEERPEDCFFADCARPVHRPTGRHGKQAISLLVLL